MNSDFYLLLKLTWSWNFDIPAPAKSSGSTTLVSGRKKGFCQENRAEKGLFGTLNKLSEGKELLGTLFDPCRLAYLTYTSNDSVRPPLATNFLTKCITEMCLRCKKRENRLSFPTFIPASSILLGQECYWQLRVTHRELWFYPKVSG
jgi:hypothetical protein